MARIQYVLILLAGESKLPVSVFGFVYDDSIKSKGNLINTSND